MQAFSAMRHNLETVQVWWHAGFLEHFCLKTAV